MNYKFHYKNTAFELFKLSFFFLYSSLAGIVNIIFTFAMLALISSRWHEANNFLRAILVFALLFFVLFQPFMMYNRARGNVKSLKELTLEPGEKGITVEVEGKHEYIDWSRVKAGKRFPGMLIIFTDSTNGYILTKRIVGKDYKKIFNDILGKIKG